MPQARMAIARRFNDGNALAAARNVNLSDPPGV